MEQLLHYVWKHKLFALKPLQTTAGQAVEIIDPGLPNMHAGPDFFNAKIKIDGVQWVAYQGSTKEGIWPDSKAATIKTKLGQPYKELPQAYVYNGLWVRLDDEGGVESFSISKDEVSQLESLNI